MKKFSLCVVLLCAAMIGCDKGKGGSGSGSGSGAGAKPSPSAASPSPTGISTIETPKPTTGTAPPATAPVGT